MCGYSVPPLHGFAVDFVPSCLCVTLDELFPALDVVYCGLLRDF